MTRDNKGRFSKTKEDGDDFPEDEQENKRFLDRPPSIKFILLFLLMTWLSTYIFPQVKDETTRRIQTHLCQTEGSDFRGNSFDNFRNGTRLNSSSTNSNKEK